MSAAVLPPKASLMTVSKGASERLISRPALEKSVLRACISCAVTTAPEAYSSLKLAFWPVAMLAPHWPAPVPALVHVLTPPGLTVQPLYFSSLVAAATSNGDGV